MSGISAEIGTAQQGYLGSHNFSAYLEAVGESPLKLLICIAFHYKQDRLHYLQRILKMQLYLMDEVHVVVTTNTADADKLDEIKAIAPATTNRFRVEIESFLNLPNPWLLTWAHKVVMTKYLGDESYTHFMYTEDDIEITPINVTYWLRAREALKSLRLYPSFFRVEWCESEKEWFSTDLLKPVSLSVVSTVRSISGDYQYLNMSNPYQGLFFYDRELMMEHAASETFDILKYGNLENLNTTWGGGVAERANYALTFYNVPNGFISRNVIPYFGKFLQIDPHCLVHHLPNNYANGIRDPTLGRIPVKDVLCP